MKTIAQQLNITDFPFEIKDKNGNRIYCEWSDNTWEMVERDLNGRIIYYQDSFNYWEKREYDSNGNRVYFQNSKGEIVDNRQKEIIEVNGIKYQRIDE